VSSAGPAHGARRVPRWSDVDIPDLTGRTAVVTGANSGIGLETAAALAARGARVVLACRNEGRARAAMATILGRTPSAELELTLIDTADLDSVRTAAAHIAATVPRLDLLINNAGVAFAPRGASPQGVEIQFATNILGHFALTGLLVDRLLAAPSARVVSVTSLAHYAGRLRVRDLGTPQRYTRVTAYAQSKLAVLLFTAELQRRMAAAGLSVRALAAHPGGARTELLRPGIARALFQFQSAAMGALPVLRAAVDPHATGGACFAPRGAFELRGCPDVGRTSRQSRNAALAAELWAAAEALTGVHYT
jgi:NAD(P)-dependent dehydrogenase (short-subunit alcohol dehydrogenase family)